MSTSAGVAAPRTSVRLACTSSAAAAPSVKVRLNSGSPALALPAEGRQGRLLVAAQVGHALELRVADALEREHALEPAHLHEDIGHVGRPSGSGADRRHPRGARVAAYALDACDGTWTVKVSQSSSSRAAKSAAMRAVHASHVSSSGPSLMPRPSGTSTTAVSIRARRWSGIGVGPPRRGVDLDVHPVPERP